MYYGTETISVLWLKLWTILSDEYKNLASLKKFKTKNKNWDLVSQNCPWRLCKTFIAALKGGFITPHVWEIVGRKNSQYSKVATILDYIS